MGSLGKNGAEFTSIQFELRVVILRNIWKRRNEFIFENKFVHPKEVNLLASKLMEHFYKAETDGQTNRADASRNQRKEMQKWISPEENWRKANQDAAVNVEAKVTRLGMCIRDSEGDIQVSASCNVQSKYQPEIAEALALRKSMDICKDLGFNNVVFQRRLFKSI